MKNPVKRKVIVIRIGLLNDVLYKLSLSNTEYPFVRHEDSIIWNAYITKRHLQRLMEMTSSIVVPKK